MPEKHMLQSVKKRNTWDLIWILFRTDFKLRYNDSFLGFIWVLIKPFSMFLIMFIVLTNILGNNIDNFGLYLLLGNMVFTFWVEGSNHGMNSIVNRASLITKVNFPRYVVLLSSSLLSVINFIINICIFAIIAIFNNIEFSLLQFVWFSFCMLVLYLLIIAVSMITSIGFARFKDVGQIWDLFNQIIFWSTPVFYSATELAKKSEIFETILFKVNPISMILISAREAVLYGDIILHREIFTLLGVIIFVGGLSYSYYKPAIKKVAEFL